MDRETSPGMPPDITLSGLFARAARNVTPAAGDWLVAQGADPAWLYRGLARFGLLRATGRADGSWIPDRSGRVFLVVPEIPLLSMDGTACFEVGDLIACDLRAPAVMYRRCTARMINPDAVAYAAFHGIDLILHADPLDYLVGGGRGCVIVRREEMSAFALTGPRRLVCATSAIAEHIDRLFRVARAPEIHVITPVKGAA